MPAYDDRKTAAADGRPGGNSPFDDPSRYVCKPRREVFDEHEESYWADPKTGAPCSPKAEGARKCVRRFGREELERIARKCNERDAVGAHAPLVLGHTDPEEADETRQPPIVGYARNFSVGYDAGRKKHMLYADFFVRKDRQAIAGEYPRVSIELWPDDGVIDPVALLRRTPQRDLAQWTVHGKQQHGGKGKLLLRYSMAHAAAEAAPEREEGKTMTQKKRRRYAREEYEAEGEADRYGADRYAAGEEEDEDDVDVDIDVDVEDDSEDEEDELPHHERVERYLKHCYSHPDASYLAKHYALPPTGAAADADGDGLAGAAAPAPAPTGAAADPTMPPSADDEEPMRNSAHGAMAYPSATNSGKKKVIQGMGTHTKKSHSKGGGAKSPISSKPDGKGTRYEKDAESIRYSRLEREIEELKREREEAREREREATAAAVVTALVADGIDLDPAEEIERLAPLSEEEREREVGRIRRRYQKAPVGGGRVPVQPVETGGRAASAAREQRDEMERTTRALQYARERPGMSFQQALDEIGGANGASGTNGGGKK